MKISKLTILVLLSLLVLPYGGLIQSLQISPAHAATPWCDASWTNRRTITIDSANVDAALTNFPLLVDLSSLSLTNATTSFFTEKSTCSKLDWELEGPNNAWVKVPSISDSIDTTLYIYYNNSVASNQTNPTGVWDSHYKGVWHLNEDATDEATSTTHTDSTSNSNHGTQSGNASSTGKIANAQDFDGTNDYVDVSDSTSLRPTTLTISTWVKPNSSQGTYARIVSKGKNGARDYNIGKQGSVLAFFYYSSGLHLWDTDTAWSTLVPNDTWTHIVVTYTSGDGSSLKMYVNRRIVCT